MIVKRQSTFWGNLKSAICNLQSILTFTQELSRHRDESSGQILSYPDLVAAVLVDDLFDAVRIRDAFHFNLHARLPGAGDADVADAHQTLKERLPDLDVAHVLVKDVVGVCATGIPVRRVV